MFRTAALVLFASLAIACGADDDHAAAAPPCADCTAGPGSGGGDGVGGGTSGGGGTVGGSAPEPNGGQAPIPQTPIGGGSGGTSTTPVNPGGGTGGTGTTTDAGAGTFSFTVQ